MPENSPHLLRVADLPNRKTTHFSLAPDESARKVIAEELGLVSLRKLTFKGELRPAGKKDWLLTAELGASVVQSCVVTLEPVKTRIDTTITRRFVSEMVLPEESEAEMPEDDTAEPLGDSIDLEAAMIESLSIELPDYPRAPSAEVQTANFTEPGKQAMTDDDAKPFAVLASLREKLDKS
jgi:uncharacterized metal-binding protein YceD (DUF177 family)